jgi:hypothetical protein
LLPVLFACDSHNFLQVVEGARCVFLDKHAQSAYLISGSTLFDHGSVILGISILCLKIFHDFGFVFFVQTFCLLEKPLKFEQIAYNILLRLFSFLWRV